MEGRMLQFKRTQPRGAIMQPGTFKKIEQSAAEKYGSKEAGQRVAGAAYKKTLKSKFKKHERMLGRKV